MRVGCIHESKWVIKADSQIIEQGRQQGLQESVVRVLSRRFRQIPQDLQGKISSLTDIQKLRNLLDASVEAKSLEELRMNGFFD